MTISSDSDVEAAEASASLQARVEEQVAQNDDLGNRLEKLHLTVEERTWIEPPPPPQPDPGALNNPDVHKLDSDTQATLDHILENSTVYRRANNRASTTLSSSSTISRSWSILSGLSMAQMSHVGVLNLPLQDTEIERFRLLADLPNNNAVLQNTRAHLTASDSAPGGSNEDTVPSAVVEPELAIPPTPALHIVKPSPKPEFKRIRKELEAASRDPPSMLSFGLVGDDLVRSL